MAIIDAEIESWLRDAAFSREAKQQQGKNYKIDRQVEKYRQELLVHAYEEELIKGIMAKEVSRATLMEYFKENRALFPSSSPVVSFEWIKAKTNTKGITSFFESWQSRKNIRFDDICKQADVECWISQNDYHLISLLQEKIPNGWYKTSDFEKKKRKQKNINGYEYFLNIVDYKKGDDQVIFEQFKDLVKMMYLNQKKVQFLQQQREQLYKDTQKQNLIKKYINVK